MEQGSANGGIGESSSRQFLPAAQPEVMRAAEKDEQYASLVYEACRDVFRHLFGTRVSVTYQRETKLLGQILYYVLTTGSGQQTLGEEYCDVIQVAGKHGLPPTPARRILLIFFQTTVPYLTERVSARIAAQSATLTESEADEITPSVSSSTASTSTPSTLRQKVNRIMLNAIRQWPSMLPRAREFLQLLLRTNLMFFYFEGLYYHISKRATGIRYVFIGKQSNQRPRYQIIGVFLLIQLCVLAAECLRRTNITSITSSFHGSSLTSETEVAVVNEDGGTTSKESSEIASFSSKSKCTLCLSDRQHPTATGCGHVFCWNCIMEWCNEKQECPLCRSPITHSSLVCLYHSDF